MHPPLEPEGSSFIQIAATVLIVSTSHWLPPRNRITPEPVNTSMSPPLTSTFHEDPPTTINHRSLKQSFSAETAIPLFVVLFTIYQSVALLFDIFTYFTSRSKLAINPDSKVNDLAAGSKQFDLAAEEIRKYTAAHDAITKKLTSTDKELETKSKEFDAKVQECAAWKEAATWIYNFLIEQLHLKDEKLAKIQVDRDAARAGRSEAEHKNAKLEEDGEAARASLNKAESKITKLKEKRDAARAGRNEAESEIKKLEEGRDAACAGQNRAEAEAIKLAKERDAAQADLDNAKAEIIELRKERDAARSGHDEVQIQCGELKKEIEAANAGQIVAAAKASKLEHDLAAARAGQAHAEDVAAGLRKELTTSKTEAAEAKAKIGGLEKDRDAARAGQASAKAHVAKWKLSFREQGKSIRKLEKYSYKIRNRELSWKITLRELNEEKARLVQVNKEKFQKAEDDRHVALEKAKKEREAEIQDLRSQLCKQKDAANGEKQEVSDLRQELKKVKDESHVKGRRADTAERHLRDRDITIKRAKDHQEAILKKAHDEHNSDMQALDRKLQDAIMIAAYERKKRDATITDLESGLQARHEVAITASKEAKEARRQAKAAEAKLITLDDRVLSFQHELKDPETQTSSLKDALHRQEREQIALVKKHRGDERSWKEQMSSLEQDLKNQKEECKATDEMLAARHQELEQKNEKIKEQKAELIQTKPELDKKETKRIELEGQIVPLQHALKKSRSACSKLDEALQSNRDALTKLNALVAGMEVQPFAGHAKELDTIEKLKEENLLAANNIRILNLIRKKILQVAGENEASAELVFPRDLIDHIQAGLKEVLNMLDPKHTRRQVGDPQVADAIDEDIAQVKFFVQANLAMMQGAQGFIEQLKGAWIELTNVQKMLSCMEEQLFDDNKDTDDVLCYLDKNFQDQISTRVIAMMKRKVEDMAEENMTTWDDEKVIKKLQEKEHAKQELRQQVKGMQKQVTGLREELTRAVEKNNDQVGRPPRQPLLE